MTKAEFDKLPVKERKEKVSEVLIHWMVQESINPLFRTLMDFEDMEIAKIVLGEYMNGELIRKGEKE